MNEILFIYLYFFCFSFQLFLFSDRNKTLRKKIEIDKTSKSILKLPENNLPDYLKKDFFSKNLILKAPKDLKIIFKWKMKKHS